MTQEKPQVDDSTILGTRLSPSLTSPIACGRWNNISEIGVILFQLYQHWVAPAHGGSKIELHMQALVRMSEGSD